MAPAFNDRKVKLLAQQVVEAIASNMKHLYVQGESGPATVQLLANGPSVASSSF
ncbi:hypothetical protein PZL22_005535 (plasmid) [Sinorhizobium kummerowiae]|uniref:Uncharacterized protein n=1 Tax=Sinorhizobium kummerowiae TaxID=158892 RepID=A0ABY8TFB4_9HYPH|nr:hypothetical protein PZL22_005535 [Sinorhizobium kummerowiae]